ncbi:MAG: protein kinase, partial [Dokdonella sp.]
MPNSSERWEKISVLFDEWVELDPGLREQRLTELAATDAPMADEVRALLMADEGVNTILDGNAASSVPGILTDLDSVPGDGVVGPYRLLRSIGIGGMGEVWLAERTDGAYEQHVAVKLLKRGMDSNLILRRFLQERQILARLHHNHIVRLIDGGMSSEGRPFYVMDFVDGQPITDYAASHSLDVRARTTLLASVADAVAYAHSQLIVHRDLKPSNVLVDGEGEPRVLDFGIAKLIEESDDPAMTGTGMRVLSPAYAAPEQILGEPIGTATDVYALGLILCELLTGQLPQQRQTTSLPQLAADVSQHVLDRASVLARHATSERIAETYGSDVSPKSVAQKVSGDLDLIVATALQREPSRRYQTASALADDLRRWLEGRPISARADSTGYRLNRFIRRNRAGVAATVLIALSLVAGLGAALWQADKASRQAELAYQQAQRADKEAVSARQSAQRSRRVTAFLMSIFTHEHPLRRTESGATTLAQAFDDALERVDTEFADDPMLLGELLDDFGEVTTSRGKLDQSQALFERALALAEQTRGLNDPAVAESLVNLGVVASYRGDVMVAKPYLLRAVTILEPHARELPRDYANALSALSVVMDGQGSRAEAERLQRRAIEILRDANVAPGMLIAALSNLATSQSHVGNYSEAESLANEALAIAERDFGKDSANVIPPLWTLEVVAEHRGDLKEEQSLVERRLAVARSALPPGHPWLAITLGQSGFMLMRVGKAKEGEARMREALDLLEREGNEGDDVQFIQRRLWIG